LNLHGLNFLKKLTRTEIKITTIVELMTKDSSFFSFFLKQRNDSS